MTETTDVPTKPPGIASKTTQHDGDINHHQCCGVPVQHAVFQQWFKWRESFDILGFFGFVPDTLFEPWKWWQFLTYGFFHDLNSPIHILFNMIMLYVFGRMVEARMGAGEFLRFYLLAIVIGGIIGATTGLAMDYIPTAAETVVVKSCRRRRR